MSAPHGEIGLGGPGLWVVLAILLLTGLAAAAVVFDVARRVWGTKRALATLWVLPQLAYLVALAWAFASDGAGLSARAILVSLIVAIPAQVAYALWVVSPRRSKVEEDPAEVPRTTLSDDGPLEPRST